MTNRNNATTQAFDTWLRNAPAPKPLPSVESVKIRRMTATNVLFTLSVAAFIVGLVSFGTAIIHMITL